GLASSGYLLTIADNGEMCELHPDGYRRTEIIVVGYAGSHFFRKMVADSNAPVQDKALQREFPPCLSPPPDPYSFPLITIRHGQLLEVDGEIDVVQSDTTLDVLHKFCYDLESLTGWNPITIEISSQDYAILLLSRD
ncbi:hypothetical protein Tco_0352144, partial [Tanacetum coccineum]